MTKIEIGKEYHISPQKKKGYEENEYFEHNETGFEVSVTTVYRGCDYIIKIMNEAEKKMLEEYQQEKEYEFHIDIDDFSNHEFVSSWDGCSTEVDVEEGVEEWIQEKVGEEGANWLLENNYESARCENYLATPLDVEEVDPDNRYN